MPLPYFVSLMLFVTFSVYGFWGFYTLTRNSNRALNRIFFIFCLSMCLWTFCDSIANSAPNHEVALFWHRLASLGWGPVCGVLLHYILVLTEKRNLLEKGWVYLLLYLPGALTVFAFGAHPELAVGQYNLVESATGWVNLSINSLWYQYFYIYCASFMLTGLVLLWQWGRSTRDIDSKKQAYLLIGSFALAIILGVITDIVINPLVSFQVPKLAPVFGLIPATTIYYFIKRSGVMGSTKGQISEAGKILSETSLAQLYTILSVLFVYGGILHFAARYFFEQESFTSTLSFSAFFILIAIIMQIIRRAPVSVNFKETGFILIVSISVLFITLRFVEYVSITVWAVSFVALIICILFDKQRMMLLSGIVILITQILVWILAPTATVFVEGSDHLARIGILLMAFMLTYYVHWLLIQRLDEIRAQIRFQKMISQISTEFVSVSESNLDRRINDMLRMCGENFQVERSCFVSLFPEPRINEWRSEGVEPADDMIADFLGGTFPWLKNEMQKNDVIHIPDVEMLPHEAEPEKAMFKHHNVRSLLSIPVINQGRTLGVLFFASLTSVDVWQENHKELIIIVANILADAMVKVEAEKEINYLAYYDGVTQLPNRALFKNRLVQGIHLARRTEKHIGVVFLDLDSFKAINDTIGHDGGDEMLRQVSARLANSLRKYDTVARFGGDEFLISINQVDRIGDIKKIADGIMRTFVQPFMVKGQEFFISASAGISVYPNDGEKADILIKNADMAMYASKNKGKNQYTLCSPTMKADVLKKMKLTNGLYRALERNELVLHYQPQVSVSTRKIIGCEALIRWKHPDYGMIPPQAFVPLAEQTGLIRPIGEWVLQTGCRQIMEWQGNGLPSLRIAVNLSIEQFRDPALIGIVAGVLEETGLDPKYLELELTESATSYESDYTIRVLGELKKLGVSIAIDDFGIEYSSLSRLKDLPVDRIKIDKKFVQSITESDKDEAIAKTMVQLAKNLKLNVTAEGVETQSQFDFFGNQMCDVVQGYYFFKPMPKAEVEAVLFSKSS